MDGLLSTSSSPVRVAETLLSTTAWDEILLEVYERGRQRVADSNATSPLRTLVDLADWIRQQEDLITSKAAKQYLLSRLSGGTDRFLKLHAQRQRSPFPFRPLVHPPPPLTATDVIRRDDIKPRVLARDLQSARTFSLLTAIRPQVTIWSHMFYESNRLRQETEGNPCEMTVVKFVDTDALGPRYLLTAGEDGFIKLFDLHSGLLSISLKRHLWGISSVLVLHEQGVVISGCRLGHLRTWRLKPDLHEPWRPEAVVKLNSNIIFLREFATGKDEASVILAVTEGGQIMAVSLDTLLEYCHSGGPPPGSFCDVADLLTVLLALPQGFVVSTVQATRLPSAEASEEMQVLVWLALGQTKVAAETQQPRTGEATTTNSARARSQGRRRQRQQQQPLSEDIETEAESLRTQAQMKPESLRRGAPFPAESESHMGSGSPRMQRRAGGEFEVLWPGQGDGSLWLAMKLRLPTHGLRQPTPTQPSLEDLPHCRPEALQSGPIGIAPRSEYLRDSREIVAVADGGTILIWGIADDGHLVLKHRVQTPLTSDPPHVTASPHSAHPQTPRSDPEPASSNRMLSSEVLNRLGSKARTEEQKGSSTHHKPAAKQFTMVTATTKIAGGRLVAMAEALVPDLRRTKTPLKIVPKKMGIMVLDPSKGKVVSTALHSRKLKMVISLLVAHPFLPSVVLAASVTGFLLIVDVAADLIIWHTHCESMEWLCGDWHPGGLEFAVGQHFGTFTIYSPFLGDAKKAIALKIADPDDRSAKTTALVFPDSSRFRATPLMQFLNADFSPLVEVIWSPGMTVTHLQARARQHTHPADMGRRRYSGQLFDHHYSRQPHEIVKELQIVCNDRQSHTQVPLLPVPFLGFVNTCDVVLEPAPGAAARSPSRLVQPAEADPVVLRNMLIEFRHVSDKVLVGSDASLRLCVPLPRMRPPQFPQYVSVRQGGPALSSPEPEAPMVLPAPIVLEELGDADDGEGFDHDWVNSGSDSSASSSSTTEITSESDEDDSDDEELISLSSNSSVHRMHTRNRTSQSSRRTRSRNDEQQLVVSSDSSSSDEDDLQGPFSDTSSFVAPRETPEHRAAVDRMKDWIADRNAVFTGPPLEVPFIACVETPSAMKILDRVCHLILLTDVDRFGGEVSQRTLDDFFPPSLIAASSLTPQGSNDLVGGIKQWVTARNTEVGKRFTMKVWHDALKAFTDEKERPDERRQCLLCGQIGNAQTNYVGLTYLNDFLFSAGYQAISDKCSRHSSRRSRGSSSRKSSVENASGSLWWSILEEKLKSIANLDGPDAHLSLQSQLEILGPFQPDTERPERFYCHRGCLSSLMDHSQRPVMFSSGPFRPFTSADLDGLLRMRGLTQGGRLQRSRNEMTIFASCDVCDEGTAHLKCMFCDTHFHYSCAAQSLSPDPPFSAVRPTKLMSPQEFLIRSGCVICNDCSDDHYWPLLSSGGNGICERFPGRGQDVRRSHVPQLGDVIRFVDRPDGTRYFHGLFGNGTLDGLIVDLQIHHSVYNLNAAGATASMGNMLRHVDVRAEDDEARLTVIEAVMRKYSHVQMKRWLNQKVDFTLTILILPPHPLAGDLQTIHLPNGELDPREMAVVFPSKEHFPDEPVSSPTQSKLRDLEHGIREPGLKESWIAPFPVVSLPRNPLLPLAVAWRHWDDPAEPVIPLAELLDDDLSGFFAGKEYLLAIRAITALMFKCRRPDRVHNKLRAFDENEEFTTEGVASTILHTELPEELETVLDSVWDFLNGPTAALEYEQFTHLIPLPPQSILERLPHNPRQRSHRAELPAYTEDLPPWLGSYCIEIANPIALMSILHRLKMGYYRSKVSFRFDFDELVNNAVRYNGSNEPIARKAEDLRKTFWDLVSLAVDSILPSSAMPLQVALGEPFGLAAVATEWLLKLSDVLTDEEAAVVLAASLGTLPRRESRPRRHRLVIDNPDNEEVTPPPRKRTRRICPE